MRVAPLRAAVGVAPGSRRVPNSRGGSGGGDEGAVRGDPEDGGVSATSSRSYPAGVVRVGKRTGEAPAHETKEAVKSATKMPRRSVTTVPPASTWRHLGSKLIQDPPDRVFFAHRSRQPKNGTNRTSKKSFVTRESVGPLGGAVVVPSGPFQECAMIGLHVATGKNSFVVESLLAFEKPSNPHFTRKCEKDVERVAERGSRFPRSRSTREDPAIDGGEVGLEEGTSVLRCSLGLVRGIGRKVVVVVRVEVRDPKPRRERPPERGFPDARSADDVDSMSRQRGVP